ncbi:MAG: hypothetical protein HY892_17910 [Deltaproteobacteria bacterium]|nr:hypothetical protein [Deltaproteobacteria bacterium]
MKKLIFPFWILIGVLLAWPAFGYNGLVEVSIRSDRGFYLPTFPVSSEQAHTYRTYVEAVRGERYSVRVVNRSPYRLGVVIAVDGRNIISGKKSFLQPQERMYILDPHGAGLYEGWRTGRDRVNRFYFTEAGDSYAGAWGDHSAMGVIAVAVFPERRPPEPPPATIYEPEEPYRHQDRKEGLKKSAPQPMMPRAEAQPGTGFGEGRYSPSRRVDFEPEPVPVERHFLKYEWRETLCRRGIIDCRPSGNRFWDEGRGYAPYPPGR